MTSATDNRTTELREKLNKLVIELDRLDIALDSPASDMTLGEYEQKREKLLDGFIQAIAATLGSGTCENVAREWEKTSFAHACTSFCCSECGAHYIDAECYYAGLADKDEEQIRTNFCPCCGRKVVGE